LIDLQPNLSSQLPPGPTPTNSFDPEPETARAHASDSPSNGIELAAMNFSFPPSSPRGGPVFNYRSEGRSFAKSNRCLIPASAFFEFTGKKYPKAKHRFTLNDAPILAIAGIWREGKADAPPAFTMLTTEPGPDIAPFHDRQIVVVQPGDWAHWIYLTKPESELLRPLGAGTLSVETVRPGSDG
jgi:putative SOS response-associated peptidase YedK